MSTIAQHKLNSEGHDRLGAIFAQLSLALAGFLALATFAAV